jgi:transcriptional regulator with XRE-family HTH domain
MIIYDELEIGLKIKQLRELKKMSRDQMVEKLGISPRMLANIETESNNVDLRKLVEICNALECSLEQLLGFNGKNIFTIQNHPTKQKIVNQGIINEGVLIDKLLASKDELIRHLQEELKSRT